jgi:DNA helicase-2/ATP-dependent DNA helicase PcrA
MTGQRGVPDGQLGFDLDLPLGLPPAERRPAAAAQRRGPVSAIEIAEKLGRPSPTPEQIAVIEAPLEPLLVIAGAGSGKTETMAARVVWLVANGLVEPDQVLGLTFTRKAAGELAERVRARLRALYRRGLISEPRPVTVSTYHAYAASVLGDNALRLGIEPGARLLGEAGGWQMVDELVERWDGDMTGVDAARATVVDAVLALAGECAEHLLEPGQIDQVAEEVLERIETLPKNLGDAVPARPKADVKAIGQRMQARRSLIPLVQAYQRRKREQEVLDFGDQVALAAQLAREVPEVGAGERERYRVVLLDEYQDTSHAQVVLLQSLFAGGHPVVAVGDPNQSIYAWRGASAGTLQRFGRDFPLPDGSPAGVRQLSTSWRNDHAILSVANRLAAPLRQPPSWGDPALTVDVQALIARPGAGPGRVRLEWHATVDDEARAVADIAAHSWHSRKADGSRSSIAVLCRTRSQFPLVEAALRKRGLPVEVIGLGGLLHVPEIADLRAALEVVHDPTRGDALMRLLTGPAWRLGARDLDGLGAWSRELAAQWKPPSSSGSRPAANGPAVETDAVDEQSIVEAMDSLPDPGWRSALGQELSDPGRRRLSRLALVLRGLRARTGLPLPDLILEAERALLLDVEVAAMPGRSPAAARAHLDAFTDVAAAFADGGDRPTLGTFLGWLSAAETRERGLDTGVVEQHEDAIQLLTVHGAKGLEWDVVAVTGLVEGTFPAGHSGRPPKRSKGWLGDIGAVPFPLRGDADGLPQWAYQAAMTQDELDQELKIFMERCGAHEVAEERRLAYVAATRARDSLLLTGAVWGDGSTPRDPSRFMEEFRELAEGGPDGENPDEQGLFGAGPVEGESIGTIAVGHWVDVPDEGAENPRAVDGRTAVWPDPLDGRRETVEAGAELVGAALVELAAEYGTTVGMGSGVPGSGERAVASSGGSAEPFGGQAVISDEEAAWAREVELLIQERDDARSGDLTVRLPSHLSASRVVALAADPVALAERLRRPMPEQPSPQARRGSAFHAWLERRFGAAALVDIDDLPGAGDDVDDGDTQALAGLQAAFLGSEWADRTAEAVEVSIETPIAGIVLRGRIDAVFARPGGGWDVVDWKTGRPPGRDSAQAVAVQLAVYRIAWARLNRVGVDQVSAAFFYASTGETVRPVDLLDEAALQALLTLPA